MNRRRKQREEDDGVPLPRRRPSDPFLGVALLLAGIFGFFTAYMNLNTRRVKIAILEGPPALLMSSACIVGSVVILTGVIEKADSKKSGRDYSEFRWLGTRLGWALAVSALVTHLVLNFII